jgi:hypothetical protein
MIDRVLVWVQGAISGDVKVVAYANESGDYGPIAVPLQKWLDKGWRFSMMPPPVTTENQCTALFLQRERYE